MRLADPKPGICSVCYCADPEKAYVDFDVAFDGHPVLNDEGTIALLPNGTIGSHDDLNICETCVREACELLGLKPELHGRQLREIDRLGVLVAHWQATAKRLQAALEQQLQANLAAAPAPARRAPRPKVVV